MKKFQKFQKGDSIKFQLRGGGNRKFNPRNISEKLKYL